jgi:hypothetical protein
MWSISDPRHDAILHEIGRLEDRGAALVAASLLEGELLETIKCAYRRDRSIEGAMFKGYGPLASLSAKIDLGYLLWLYPESSRKLLHRIRTIRNIFAHSSDHMTFETQKIRDLCLSLYPISNEYALDTSPKSRRGIVSQMINHIESGEVIFPIPWDKESDLDSPRIRFMDNVRAHLEILDLWRPFLRNRAIVAAHEMSGVLEQLLSRR